MLNFHSCTDAVNSFKISDFLALATISPICCGQKLLNDLQNTVIFYQNFQDLLHFTTIFFTLMFSLCHSSFNSCVPFFPSNFCYFVKTFSSVCVTLVFCVNNSFLILKFSPRTCVCSVSSSSN